MSHSFSEEQLSHLSEFIETRIGLHFPKKRWRDLERGLNSAARESAFDDSGDYVEWLLSSASTTEQIESLVSHLTVGETYFFRDRKLFQVLEDQVLPGLILQRRQAKQKHVRIWSAGCATGEEPYSVAILLRKMLPDLSDWSITILATDINPHFLKKAAEGRYGNWSFRDIPPGIQEKFFKQADDGRFEILPDTSRMVTFYYLNLAEDFYPSLFNNTNAMDIIFCRNVLMYFAPERVSKVVHNLRRSLVDGGWLIASPGEASQVFSSRLATVSFPGAILYRNERQPPTIGHGLPRETQTGTGTPNAMGVESVPVWSTGAAREAENEPRETQDLQPQTPSAKQATPLKRDLYRDALAFYHDGRYPEAAQTVTSLLLQYPASTDSMALLARIYANLGELDDALEWCEKAIRAEKLNAGIHYLMATVLQELGRIGEAEMSLKRALFLDPRLIMAHVALGNLTRQCGKHADSEKHFRNALSLLNARPPDDVCPESEGMTAGRLMEFIKSTAAEAGIAILKTSYPAGPPTQERFE